MKHIDINSSTYNDFDVEIKEKMEILNLKLMIIKQFLNIKTFLQKVTLQIGLKMFLWLKKLKLLCSGHM